VSEQQDRSADTADHRSIVPSVPGVPWWAAIVLAVTGVAAGFAFDAGSGKELTSVFSGLYVLGCLAAVLAVRQEGVFTAVIQPPLILFCAVPGAYFLFHGAKYTGVKDLVINCGYPLIERFPLMLFTAAGVLLVGLVRWYLGHLTSRRARDPEAAQSASAGLVSRLAGLFNRDSADDEAEVEAKPTRTRARREHAVERSARSAPSERRSGRRPAPSSRTRRPRPPLDEAAEPTRERVRRRPTRDLDGSEPPRRRQPRDPELRGRPSRDGRRDPNARRPRPAPGTSRFDAYETGESFDAPPRRRRPAPNGDDGTHHPISQVRYRKAAGGDESFDERPRRPRRPSSDWD
jgi:hypothetical protein